MRRCRRARLFSCIGPRPVLSKKTPWLLQAKAALPPGTWAAVLKPAQCRWVPSRLLSKSTDLARHDGHKRRSGSHCKGVRSKQTARHVPGMVLLYHAGPRITISWPVLFAGKYRHLAYAVFWPRLRVHSSSPAAKAAAHSHCCQLRPSHMRSRWSPRRNSSPKRPAPYRVRKTPSRRPKGAG